MDMHPKLSTWLHQAKIKPTDDVIRKWWTATSGFEVDATSAIQLCRVAMQFGATQEFETQFFKAIQAQDAAFLPNSKMAMAIMAAVRLDVVLDNDADEVLAELAALGLVAASSAADPKRVYLKELVGKARDLLGQFSHGRADWDYVRSGPAGADTEEAGTATLRTALGVCMEETNMLWWLTGETSRDLKERFAKLDEGAVAVLAGKELADLTVILPGPECIGALADRAIRQGRAKPAVQVGLAGAIGSLPVVWREGFAKKWKDSEILRLCPVAAAIVASDGVKPAQWPGVFADTTGWAKTQKIEPAKLGVQVYTECLLAQAWEASGP